MQANNTNDEIFNDEFFDQAWADMNEKLDREMPVEKKRRRFLLWYFLMAGCTIGFLFWFSISSNNQNTSQNTLPDLIAETSETSTASPVTVTEEQNNNNEVSPKENTLPTHTFNQDLKPEIKKEIAFSNIVNEQQKFSITIENSKPKSITQKGRINSFTKIQNLPIQDLEHFNEELAIKEDYLSFEKIDVVDLPKRKMEFNTLVGLTYDFSTPKKINFVSGIEIHFPIRKRWGIQTGLAFSLFSKNGTISSSQTHEAILADNSMLNPNGYSLYEVQTNVQHDFKNIQYLEIPFLATFQIGDKWRLQTGINWSNALHAKVETSSNQSLILINNNPNSTLPGSQIPTISADELSAHNIADNLWKNDFVSGVLGISWKPNKRLSLTLRYHTPWSNINLLNNSSNRLMDLSFGSQLSVAFDPFATNEAFYGEKGFYKSLRFMAGYHF